jgi:N,N'-diacetylchitobiose transport system permease protein
LARSPVPHTTTAAVAAPLRGRRRRPLSVSGVGRGAVPYLLVLPVVVAIVAILGYPLYRLATLSFQRYGLPELIQRHGEWIGLDNYRSVLSDSVFWDTLVRTIVFTAVNVGLTMVLGTLIALLLVRLAAPVRILLLTGLVLVWSMPAVVAVQVWYWMTNFQNGVVNHILTVLRLGDFDQHDWYSTTFWKLAMVTLLIVWGALPFVTVTMYAGLSQVPRELVEAARIDGASPWRVFRDITFPTVKPIVYILTSLSIIWDFGVFTQPYLLIGASHVDSSNYLMGVYVFIEGYAHSDFGRGAAISILMLVMVAAMSVLYVRRMVRMGEVT